jgi:hypothetical protein
MTDSSQTPMFATSAVDQSHRNGRIESGFPDSRVGGADAGLGADALT